MRESSYYLYLWQNPVLVAGQVVWRTCFGITGNVDNRRNGYEGHVGHTVEFLHLWSGPERVIRTLEDKIKQDFADYLVIGHRGYRYEWITEQVDIQQILQYLEWEISCIPSVIKVSTH